MPRTAVKLVLFGSFNPATSLPGLKEWLRADAGTYQDNSLTTAAAADGDPVGGWKDQSGAGKDALQGTTAAKPTLKLGANGIGARPALLFDGGDFLQTAAFAVPCAQPTTIYAVFKFQTTAEGANRAIYDGLAGGHRNVFLKETSNPGKYELYAGTALPEAASTINTSAHLSAALFNGASSQLWIDNTSKVAGAAGTDDLTGLTVGADISPGSNMVGLIAELLIYNAEHTPAQRGRVQTYLATKYGITLA